MIVKSIVFVSCFLGMIGCGVMSDPKDEEKKSVEIADGTLMLSDGNISFLFSGWDVGITELTTFKVFEAKDKAEAFLSELNTTAQTLEEKERMGIEEWVERIVASDINYHDKNLLFYPLFQSLDCGIKKHISTENNTAVITVEALSETCEDIPLYHILVYSIDKSIQDISIQAFEQSTVTFPNKASE